MPARPGIPQSAFTAGEINELLVERYELKYRANGLRYAENVLFFPQGGFGVRPGLKDVGAVAADAARLFPFKSSVGQSYDLVLRPAEATAYDATSALFTFAIPSVTAAMLPELTFAQEADTAILFHEDLQSKRIKHSGPTSWSVDDVPYKNLPNYDYGGTYTNGVAAKWQLEFVGLVSGSTLFTLEVLNETTPGIVYDSDMLVLASKIEAAILNLPNVAAGATAVSASGAATGTKIDITFGGTENIAKGDAWYVAGTVIAKADAAVVASKTVVGVAPGEPVISATQGWPACGNFINQRLLVGGLKALKNAYLMSVSGDYYNFDTRFTEANGATLVPMDIESGERIVAMVDDRNPVIMTDQGEYWLGERTLSATATPNHIQSGNNGARLGVPVVKNESAILYAHANGSVLGEYRYTDVNGNYLPTDISLLASHLVENLVDMARQRAVLSTDGNRVGLVQSDGQARLATVLREQEVTAFARLTSKGDPFKAVSVNGRNEMGFLVQRPDARHFERLDANYLLDEAIDFANAPASGTVTGLAKFDGREVWAIGDDNVFGPFTVTAGTITLPVAVSAGYVGTWTPLRVETLPPSSLVAQNVAVKRRGRIHSVNLSVIDTTSLAVGGNNGALRDVALANYGMIADQPELQVAYTGEIQLRGFYGYLDEPTIVVSQLRPGRMTVRSITMEVSYG